MSDALRPTLRRRFSLETVLVLLAGALTSVCGVACGGARRPAPLPPVSVLPVAPGPSAAQAEVSSSAGSLPFAPLRDRVIAELLDDEPSTARALGLHEYDAKVKATSEEAIAAEVARLRKAADDLTAVPPTTLSPDDALDRAELKSWVEQKLFWLVDVDTPRKWPTFYESLFDVSSYIEVDYAPLAERAKRLVAHEEAALAEVADIRANLTPPLSKPMAEVSARNMAGFATYLRGEVAKEVGAVGDPPQRARFAAANSALANAAEDLALWLKRQADHGDQSHVLGPARYAKLLAVQEGLTTPIADLERMNEENLEANKRAYEALAAGVKVKPVQEKELYATGARIVAQARAFLVDHSLVTLPGDGVPVVRPTPPYMRWDFAFAQLSGPFEKAASAYYDITPPDSSWSRTKREEYLGSLGILFTRTVHETFPGHFVQLRWQARAPTRVQKMYHDYAFVEGWAHYGEQMMIEQGFGKDDPEGKLAMLRDALLRNCRFWASIAIHTEGVTVEQAESRFVNDCHQDLAGAHEQALRGTFDPGYFAYTLGKLQILALREEAKQKLGGRFSLQRFHDALLSHGAPPLALIHDRVLHDLGAM